jgi:ABC-type multidrug transport system ATPase subunit
MQEYAVFLSGVRKGFGRTSVISDVSLKVAQGSVFGLVGLNGAGKTTLIRIMLGLLKQDCGECRILGYEPSRHESAMYRKLGVVLENNGFWGNLSVMQNLRFFAEAGAVSKPELQAWFNENRASTSIAGKTGKVKYFSRGEKMQCALCRAFMGRPSLLIFDEPAIALDIQAYDHFCAMVRQARSNGAAVVISSHQLDAIEELCDSVGILENGAISLFPMKQSALNCWLLRADGKEEFGGIIKEIAGSAVYYAGGAWHFELAAANENAVSTIVARLVAAGGAVGEVRREKDDLRESLRKYYSGKK